VRFKKVLRLFLKSVFGPQKCPFKALFDAFFKRFIISRLSCGPIPISPNDVPFDFSGKLRGRETVTKICEKPRKFD
jgi:hypothetical protein